MQYYHAAVLVIIQSTVVLASIPGRVVFQLHSIKKRSAWDRGYTVVPIHIKYNVHVVHPV